MIGATVLSLQTRWFSPLESLWFVFGEVGSEKMESAPRETRDSLELRWLSSVPVEPLVLQVLRWPLKLPLLLQRACMMASAVLLTNSGLTTFFHGVLYTAVPLVSRQFCRGCRFRSRVTFCSNSAVKMLPYMLSGIGISAMACPLADRHFITSFAALRPKGTIWK